MKTFLELFEAVSEARQSKRQTLRNRKKWEIGDIEVCVSDTENWRSPNNLHVFSYESGWMPATKVGYLIQGQQVKNGGKGRTYEILKIRNKQ